MDILQWDACLFEKIQIRHRCRLIHRIEIDKIPLQHVQVLAEGCLENRAPECIGADLFGNAGRQQLQDFVQDVHRWRYGKFRPAIVKIVDDRIGMVVERMLEYHLT